MPLSSTSLAAGQGGGVQNVQFTPSANDIPRNIVIIGTFNPALAGSITVETIYGPYSNAGQVALVFGAGWMLHRLAIGVFNGLGAGGANVWVIPQAEVAGAQATSSSTVISGPATAAGTLNFYIDNIKYACPVASGDSATTIGTNLAALVAADPNCPVTGNAVTGTFSLTAKSKGPQGNAIPIAYNIQAADSLPAGVTATIVPLAGGTGVPVIANALNALGTGTNANNLPAGNWMTDLVHGYLATATVMATPVQDQTTLTAIGTYCGLASANPPTGCYDHLVGKPFRCINGDTTNSASLPAALVTLCGTTNTNDRTDALLCVPGSRTHPCEIAAVATGVINARTAQIAASSYAEMVLPGVEPGPTGMWTTDYTNRDTAVKAGISPTVARGGYVVLQNIVTFYASNTGVASTSNIYREFVNLVKIANMIWSLISTFRGTKWTGCFIVADSSRVTDPVAKTKARSTSDVIDELVGLAKAWYGKGWVYNSDFIINALKSTTSPAVTLRTGGDGFVNQIPAILSGVLNIIDSTINADISLAGVS
jgi:phage tail sheath gpL-like